MNSGLTFTVCRDDTDYLGLTIRAWDDRFAGTTFIFSQGEQLEAFANSIEGFPAAAHDERTFEFGHRLGEPWAGGYAKLVLRYPHPAGGAALDVFVEDAPDQFAGRSIDVVVHTEAAFVDRFVMNLRSVVAGQRDPASLNASG